MARKKTEEGLSKRQRQSKQFIRDKELQIKRQQFFRKAKIIGLSVGGFFLVIGSIWSWKTDFISRSWQATTNKIYEITGNSGYTIKDIWLEGRSRTPTEEINRALDVNKNAPIFSISLTEMRERLEKIESIKYAEIERSLPSTLYVRIIERDPVALWQYQGKIALVDDKGTVMTGLDLAPYKNLPLIVGEDAQNHVVEIIDILTAEPELAKRFVAAVRIGERRWNIRLHPKQTSDTNAEDIEIMLPEKDPKNAWKNLAELQKKQQILDRELKVIDLRIDGRLFIKLPEEDIKPKPSNTKDI